MADALIERQRDDQDVEALIAALGRTDSTAASTKARHNAAHRTVAAVRLLVARARGQLCHRIFGVFSRHQYAHGAVPFTDTYRSHNVRSNSTNTGVTQQQTRCDAASDTAAMYRTHMLAFIDTLQEQLAVLTQTAGNAASQMRPNPHGVELLRDIVSSAVEGFGPAVGRLAPAIFRVCRESAVDTVSQEIADMASVYQILGLVDIIYLKSGLPAAWKTLVDDLVVWLNNSSTSEPAHDASSSSGSTQRAFDYQTEFNSLRTSKDAVSDPRYWRVIYRSLIRGKLTQVRDLFSLLVNADPYKLQQVIVGSLFEDQIDSLSEEAQTELITSLTNDLHQGIASIESGIKAKPDPLKFDTIDDYSREFHRWRTKIANGLTVFDNSLISTLIENDLCNENDSRSIPLSKRFVFGSVFERIRLVYLILIGDTETIVEISNDWQEVLVSLIQFCHPTTSVRNMYSLLDKYVVNRKDYGGPDMAGMSHGFLDSVCLSLIKEDIKKFVVYSDKAFDKLLLVTSLDLLMHIDDLSVINELSTFKFDLTDSGASIRESMIPMDVEDGNSIKIDTVTIYDIRDYYVMDFAQFLFTAMGNFCWIIAIDTLAFVGNMRSMRIAKEFIRKRLGFVDTKRYIEESSSNGEITIGHSTKIIRNKAIRKLQCVCEKYGFRDVLSEIAEVSLRLKMQSCKLIVKTKHGEKVTISDADITDILLDLRKGLMLAEESIGGQARKKIESGSVSPLFNTLIFNINDQISEVLCSYVLNDWSKFTFGPHGFISAFKPFFKHLFVAELAEVTGLDVQSTVRSFVQHDAMTKFGRIPNKRTTSENTLSVEARLADYAAIAAKENDIGIDGNDMDVDEDGNNLEDPIRSLLRMLAIQKSLPDIEHANRPNLSASAMIPPLVLFKKYCMFWDVLLESIVTAMKLLASELLKHEVNRRKAILAKRIGKSSKGHGIELGDESSKEDIHKTPSKKRGRSSYDSSDTENESPERGSSLQTPGKQRKRVVGVSVSVQPQLRETQQNNGKYGKFKIGISVDDDLGFLRTRNEALQNQDKLAQRRESRSKMDKHSLFIDKLSIAMGNGFHSLGSLILEVISGLIRPEHSAVLGPCLTPRAFKDAQIFFPMLTHTTSALAPPLVITDTRSKMNKTTKINAAQSKLSSSLFMETLLKTVLDDAHLTESVMEMFTNFFDKTQLNLGVETPISSPPSVFKNTAAPTVTKSKKATATAAAAAPSSATGKRGASKSKEQAVPASTNMIAAFLDGEVDSIPTPRGRKVEWETTKEISIKRGNERSSGKRTPSSSPSKSIHDTRRGTSSRSVSPQRVSDVTTSLGTWTGFALRDADEMDTVIRNSLLSAGEILIRTHSERIGVQRSTSKDIISPVEGIISLLCGFTRQEAVDALKYAERSEYRFGQSVKSITSNNSTKEGSTAVIGSSPGLITVPPVEFRPAWLHLV